MQETPENFYEKNKTNYLLELKTLKQRLFLVGMLRLAVFLLAAFGVYLLVDTSIFALITAGVGLAVFLYLVSFHTDIKKKKMHTEALITMNELELQVLKRNYDGLETGAEFVFEEHFYNQDIDLFGSGSIFQLINRTATKAGKEKLAGYLNANETTAVAAKQAAIQELSQKANWRQNYSAIAQLIRTKIENKTITNWLSSYQSSMPSFARFLPMTFTVLSALILVGFGLDLIAGPLLTVWFFLGLGISSVYFRKVTKLYQSASQMTDTFSQYALLLREIENENFQAEELVKAQQEIRTEGKKASAIFKALSGELNSLDQRNNFLFAFIASGFLLWDLRYAYRIEQWMKTYGKLTEKWFDAVAYFDAQGSLANYAFNYPTHLYPSLSEDKSVIITATELGHPLLKDEQRITNDFSIKREDFFIVTGANMAGKSTFLRTVALNIVLANNGLPVCASSFNYSPIKLISSMRTSDSLQNDESYFFSELKRLKYIIDKIEQDTYFIILDEILKGTNSKDKEEGSKKFVEKLVRTNSTGIIATHDLSLCELADTLPQVENHYFDAEIVNDELFFDYRFKNGICQNMNASFLLRKMEIV